MRLVGIVRTWALTFGGMSRSLFSIFARTLDRFILSLAGLEDIRQLAVLKCGGRGQAIYRNY